MLHNYFEPKKVMFIQKYSLAVLCGLNNFIIIIIKKYSKICRMEESNSSLTLKKRIKRIKNRDDHHKLQTKLLNFDQSVPNETEIKNNTKTDRTIWSLGDFVGDPLCDDHIFDVQSKHRSCDNNTNFDRSITTAPADSSCGFHNTLSVLEHHLNRNKLPRPRHQHEKYPVFYSKNFAYINNSYYMSADKSRELAVVANEINDTNMNDGSISRSSELRLESIKSLFSMYNNAMIKGSFESSSVLTTHSPFKHTANNASNSNEYIYHIARSRSGQLYLRVRRNLHLAQGTIIFNSSMSINFDINLPTLFWYFIFHILNFAL